MVSIAFDGITCCSEACGLCRACAGVVPAVFLINTHGHAPHCDQQISVAESFSKQPFDSLKPKWPVEALRHASVFQQVRLWVHYAFELG